DELRFDRRLDGTYENAKGVSRGSRMDHDRLWIEDQVDEELGEHRKGIGHETTVLRNVPKVVQRPFGTDLEKGRRRTSLVRSEERLHAGSRSFQTTPEQPDHLETPTQ